MRYWEAEKVVFVVPVVSVMAVLAVLVVLVVLVETGLVVEPSWTGLVSFDS